MGFPEVCPMPSRCTDCLHAGRTTRERGGNFTAASSVGDRTVPASAVLVQDFPQQRFLLGPPEFKQCRVGRRRLGWEMRRLLNYNGFGFLSAAKWLFILLKGYPDPSLYGRWEWGRVVPACAPSLKRAVAAARETSRSVSEAVNSVWCLCSISSHKITE